MGQIGTILLHETAGTAMLLLLGVGVVANAILAKTKGNGGGWLMISFGWGLAVFAGVYVAYKSGAHLNPAVTLGILASGADQYAPGIDITVGTTFLGYVMLINVFPDEISSPFVRRWPCKVGEGVRVIWIVLECFGGVTRITPG